LYWVARPRNCQDVIDELVNLYVDVLCILMASYKCNFKSKFYLNQSKYEEAFVQKINRKKESDDKDLQVET